MACFDKVGVTLTTLAFFFFFFFLSNKSSPFGADCHCVSGWKPVANFSEFVMFVFKSTHLPLEPHIYASVNWVSIGSGNCLSPVRRQAFTLINTDSSLFKKICLKMSSA